MDERPKNLAPVNKGAQVRTPIRTPFHRAIARRMMEGANTHDNRRPSLQFSSMTQAARLLIFAALINPTSAVVSQPNSVATTIAEGPRTVQIYWTPGATGGTPTGSAPTTRSSS